LHWNANSALHLYDVHIFRHFQFKHGIGDPVLIRCPGTLPGLLSSQHQARRRNLVMVFSLAHNSPLFSLESKEVPMRTRIVLSLSLALTGLLFATWIVSGQQ